MICALLRDFSKHGEKAIAQVRRRHPAAYLKILALLVPKELKVETTGRIGQLTDEQLDEAIEAIEEMLAREHRLPQPRATARASLLAHLGRSNVEAAEASLQQGIAVSRAQGARGWELRASTTLARLWRDQRKRTEARDLLAPIYGWFTEGSDTPDLKDAKELLDTLK